MRGDIASSITKASRPEQVRANAAAFDLILEAEDLAALDAAYPAPTRDVPHDML
jgi:diketogulonate reductase-like aldo/keto reductase